MSHVVCHRADTTCSFVPVRGIMESIFGRTYECPTTKCLGLVSFRVLGMDLWAEGVSKGTTKTLHGPSLLCQSKAIKLPFHIMSNLVSFWFWVMFFAIASSIPKGLNSLYCFNHQFCCPASPTDWGLLNLGTLLVVVLLLPPFCTVLPSIVMPTCTWFWQCSSRNNTSRHVLREILCIHAHGLGKSNK